MLVFTWVPAHNYEWGIGPGCPEPGALVLSQCFPPPDESTPTLPTSCTTHPGCHTSSTHSDPRSPAPLHMILHNPARSIHQATQDATSRQETRHQTRHACLNHSYQAQDAALTAQPTNTHLTPNCISSTRIPTLNCIPSRSV